MARTGRRNSTKRGRLAEDVGARPVTPADREPHVSLGAHNDCDQCGLWLPVSDLIRPLHVKGGGYYCGDCWEKTVAHALDRVRQGDALDSYYRRTYGIGLAQYGERYLRQQGRCAICRTRSQDEPLHVDHDHVTGDVRGLLCRGCNTGLGCFGDEIGRLSAAITYLVPTKLGREPRRRISKVPDSY